MKPNTYNLTAHCFDSKEVYKAIWREEISGKAMIHIASIVRILGEIAKEYPAITRVKNALANLTLKIVHLV